jgi:hypothetical protein
VRRVVAAAAAELPAGPDGAPGIPILRLLAGDSDAGVRARAAALLVQLLPPEKEEAPATVPSDKGEPEKRAGGHGGAAAAAADSPAPVDASVPPPDLATPDLAPEPERFGMLVVEAPVLVQFAIDHGHFQPAGKQPLRLGVGPHKLASLAGTQSLEIKEGETLTVQVEESAVEKLVDSGLDAAEHKDYRKAQKLLDKAVGICSRERKYPQPCNDLAVEAFYQLGVINQSQEKFSEAMTDYQQVVQLAGSSRARQERRGAAQKAMAELLPSLGQVVIPKQVKRRCQEVTLYMLPGTHQIDIDGESQTVKVRAQETVHLGSCP